MPSAYTLHPATELVQPILPPPLSLYIHFPWCLRKCPYCDFNSHAAKDTLPETEYIDALIADLETNLPQVWGRPVISIFMGGGTPSLFSAASMERLLSAIRARLPLQPDAEITLEANPGTFEAEKFAAYRAAGINRLSIGIQSFNAKHLQALGRIHNDQEAHAAIAIARQYFDNFNIDLMYALPGQTLAEVTTDMATALAAQSTHLSAYQLTLEPNTLFHHQPPANLPNEDVAADMQDQLEVQLATAGLVHYETSAFARPGRQTRHNLNYWTFGDYLGIGAGAHAKISFPDRIVRQMRYKQPQEYLAHMATGSAVQDEQTVAFAQRPFEFMLNALRLTEGFAEALFCERTGLPLTRILPVLDQAIADGLLIRNSGRMIPTQKGQRFLNVLLHRFLP